MDARLLQAWCERHAGWQPTPSQLAEVLGSSPWQDPTPRYVHVRYCDDIRQEVGGKQSLVGLYGGDLRVAAVPTTLPQFCVIASVATPVSRPFERVRVELLLNDQVVAGLDVPDGVLAAAISQGDEAADAVWHLHHVAIVLTSFQIERPGTLRVRVETEAGELCGNGLRLRLSEPVAKA